MRLRGEDRSIGVLVFFGAREVLMGLETIDMVIDIPRKMWTLCTNRMISPVSD